MSYKKTLRVDQKSYKNHTLKAFSSKDITNQKVKKIPTNNSLTNLKTR